MSALLDKPIIQIEQEEDKNGQPRHYLIDGERVPSVTTILRVLDKPALVHWAWMLGVQGGLEVVGSGLKPSTVEEMKSAVITRGWAHWLVRDAGGLRGRQLHKALETLIVHGDVPKLSSFDEDRRGYVQALARWWIDNDPDVVLAEQKVASKNHWFAGRLDLVIRKVVDGRERLVVTDIKSGKVDAKTGKPRPPYTEAHFQVGGGYRLALAETFGVPLADADFDAEIVNICPDGQYLVTPAAATPGDFVAVLAAYQAVKRVERNAKNGNVDSDAGGVRAAEGEGMDGNDAASPGEGAVQAGGGGANGGALDSDDDAGADRVAESG